MLKAKNKIHRRDAPRTEGAEDKKGREEKRQEDRGKKTEGGFHTPAKQTGRQEVTLSADRQGRIQKEKLLSFVLFP